VASTYVLRPRCGDRLLSTSDYRVDRVNGVVRSSPGCDGAVRSGPECDGVVRSSPECDGEVRNSPECNRVQRSAE
jgi:hypothetical protein